MDHNNYNKNLKELSRKLRTESRSSAEKMIWKRLLSRGQSGIKFKRQRPITNYIVDFFSQQIGLVIEIDGSSHSANGEQDRNRQDELERIGYSILRFTEGEVLNDFESTKEQILHCIYSLTEEE